MKLIIVLSIMLAFGLLIQHEECKEKITLSVIDKISEWWILKMKSNKTSWIIKICVLAVLYFLIRTLIG